MRKSKLHIFALLLLAASAAGSEQPTLADEAPFIDRIDFEGNHFLGDRELKGLMRTRQPRLFQFSGRPRYMRDWLRSDLATLEARYHRAGFYSVRIRSFGEGDISFNAAENSVRILIHIDEGKRRHVRRVSVEGELPRSLRHFLTGREGGPFDPQTFNADARQLMRSLQDAGCFSAIITHQSVLLETPAYAPTDSVDVIFTIQPGPLARLAEVRLVGNSLPASQVLKEITVKPGERLRLKDIIDSEQNLYDSGYYRSVAHELQDLKLEGEEGEEYYRLTWHLRERKMATLEAGVGIGTVDGLRLLGSWSHRNAFNRGQRVGAEARLSLKRNQGGNFGPVYEREAVEYRFLHFIRTRTQLSLNLFREIDFEVESGLYSSETRAARITATRRVGRDTLLRFQEQFDALYQIATAPGLLEPRYLTRSMTVVLDRDTRNHYFNPTRGGQSRLSYEIAGGVQGGDHHYQRLQWSISDHKSRAGSTVASRLFLGAAGAYGRSVDNPRPGVPADGVPYERRFYCGGATTVRGYEDFSFGQRLDPDALLPGEDTTSPTLSSGALGGRFMVAGNLEWRFPISIRQWKTLAGVFFLDGGGTWQRLEDITISRALPWQQGDAADLERVFYGVGVGLRFVTPLTVIRVDFGVPLQALGDAVGGRWHFNLGHSF